MPSNRTKLKLHQSARYRICVQGVLDASWADSFAGLAIRCDLVTSPYPVTTLTGEVIDQAMLLGVLNHLYDLGLSLRSVEWLAEAENVPLRTA